MEGRKQDVIEGYLHRAQLMCAQSDKEAQKLVTAGIVPTVILLLKARALDANGLDIVLITLGTLAYVRLMFRKSLLTPNEIVDVIPSLQILFFGQTPL
jgi:hypothetical protein